MLLHIRLTEDRTLEYQFADWKIFRRPGCPLFRSAGGFGLGYFWVKHHEIQIHGVKQGPVHPESTYSKYTSDQLQPGVLYAIYPDGSCAVLPPAGQSPTEFLTNLWTPSN